MIWRIRLVPPPRQSARQAAGRAGAEGRVGGRGVRRLEYMGRDPSGALVLEAILAVLCSYQLKRDVFHCVLNYKSAIITPARKQKS